MVIIVPVTAKGMSGSSNETIELRLAYFSVKEYSISNHIRNGLAF